MQWGSPNPCVSRELGLESRKDPLGRSGGPVSSFPPKPTGTSPTLLKHWGSASLRCPECSWPWLGLSARKNKRMDGLPFSLSLSGDLQLGPPSPENSRAKRTSNLHRCSSRHQRGLHSNPGTAPDPLLTLAGCLNSLSPISSMSKCS